MGTRNLTPVSESLIVVAGLPRSGTSLLMQMLQAGGLPVLSDGIRAADEDNPRGYFELERVKSLRSDSKWLFEARGKAVKIVAPLLGALPAGLACRVILCERDVDEVLDSQQRMLLRRGQEPSAAREGRGLLKDEYLRMLARVKVALTRRPDTHLLVIEHGAAISQAARTAAAINNFLDGGLDEIKMAAAVDPSLHRNRARA